MKNRCGISEKEESICFLWQDKFTKLQKREIHFENIIEIDNFIKVLVYKFLLFL